MQGCYHTWEWGAISENNNSINVAIDAPAKTKYTYV